MRPISGIRLGNRCGHDPRNPHLSPPAPIKSGPGCPPRILSLAAERAKEWFFAPEKCPLLRGDSERRLRSERREAIQVVLEFLLSRLDLASLCAGRPTMTDGFIDLDMEAIVAGAGLGRRRCERAIRNLKEAGFMEVKQPRSQNEDGRYFGLRAIRVLTTRFFEWLGLGPMLARERARASKVLKKRLEKYGRNLTDVMKRKIERFKALLRSKPVQAPKPKPLDNGSREGIIHIASSPSSRNAKRALREAVARFGCGIKIINGSSGGENKKDAEEFLAENSAVQYRARPYRPKDKPHTGRFIGTFRREFLDGCYGPTTAAELQETADKRLDKYRYYRPHETPGCMTPAEFSDKTGISIPRIGKRPERS
jgi:hypothetical protein